MLSGQNRSRPSTAAAGALLAFIACAGCADGEQVGSTGSGGSATGTGGSPATGTGGSPATGTGGSPATGTGGSPATGTGGVTGGGSGGATATGGRTVPPSSLKLPWMDDFEANAVGPAATGWIRHPKDTTGQWAVAMDGTTKVLQQQNAAADLAMMVGGDVGWTNFKVEAKIKIATASSSVLAMLAAHYADPSNYYFMHLKGDGQVKIRKRIGDSTEDVLSVKTGTALVAGTWYTMAFSLQGSVLTVFLNGTSVGTMTEMPASLLAGGIGLGAQDGAVSFDDVKVTAQ